MSLTSVVKKAIAAVEKKLGEAVVAGMVDIHNQLIEASPYLSGRLMANWNISSGEAVMVDDTPPGGYKGGYGNPGAAAAVARGRQKNLQNYKFGDRIYITNGTPYAAFATLNGNTMAAERVRHLMGQIPDIVRVNARGLVRNG